MGASITCTSIAAAAAAAADRFNSTTFYICITWKRPRKEKRAKESEREREEKGRKKRKNIHTNERHNFQKTTDLWTTNFTFIQSMWIQQTRHMRRHSYIQWDEYELTCPCTYNTFCMAFLSRKPFSLIPIHRVDY